MAEVRGRVVRTAGRVFVATHHPGAVLAKPALRAAVFQDLKALRGTGVLS